MLLYNTYIARWGWEYKVTKRKETVNRQPVWPVVNRSQCQWGLEKLLFEKRGGGGGWGREKSSFIFGRKLVWQVCNVTVTFLRVGVDPGNEVGTAWLHLKKGKKPSNSPSQASTIKALLRFYFILFVYLFVYYNYFFGGRGGGRSLGPLKDILWLRPTRKLEQSVPSA